MFLLVNVGEHTIFLNEYEVSWCQASYIQWCITYRFHADTMFSFYTLQEIPS